MRYNVSCPHCGKPRSLPDYALWPEDEGFPGPGRPQECLDCHGWMVIVDLALMQNQQCSAIAWKCEKPTIPIDVARRIRNQIDSNNNIDRWEIDGERIFLEGQFSADQLEAIAVLMRAGEL